MTITTATPTYVQLPGNGIATTFAFPFKVFQATDVVVGFITSAGYALQSSGYSVTNVNNNGGGNVVFSTPPPSLLTVDIRSFTPQTQGTEFANLGSYLPENSTTAMDRVTRVVQDLSRLAYTFGIHGPDTESTPWPALPAPANRLGMALMFDPITGLPAVGVPTTQTMTGALIAALLNQITNVAPSAGLVITAAEIAANVTPINYAKWPSPWKDISRFVTDNTGATDVSAQFANAIAAEKNIIIPEGTYLFNGAVPEMICRDGMHIQGATKDSTIIKLGPNVGHGVSAFRWSGAGGNNGYDVTVENLKILLQNPGQQQVGLRFLEARFSTINRVKIFGQGTAADDTTGISFDGGGTFTGVSTLIQNCYLSSHFVAINLAGVVTDLQILCNVIYGTAGAVANGNYGITLSTQTNGVVIAGNSLSTTNRCIYSAGTGLMQLGNRFENTTPAWEWVIGQATRHQSHGDFILTDSPGNATPIWSQADSDAHVVSSQAGFYCAGSPIQANRGFQEGSGPGTSLRTNHLGAALLMGYGDTQPVTMTANGGGSISGQTTTVWSVSYVGGHLYLDFNVSGTLSGSGTTALLLPLPAGVGAVVPAQDTCTILNGGSNGPGVAYVNTLGTNLMIGVGYGGTANFTPGPVQAVGQIRVRILS